MNIISPEILQELYKNQKEEKLFGKWITLEHILPLFKKHKDAFSIHKIGVSEEGRAIFTFKIGSGKKKVLLWSQMHGNESTGTRALFDLFNCFTAYNSDEIKTILEECTLLFIPILNPDGAQNYTRVNANKVDLNRDAVDRVAKESILLRKVLEDFHPSFCFNLHDQRTIFNVEGTQNPATISFLAPSEEETRALTKGRIETMNVIVAMNAMLQQLIPNFVGRYTDEFYPTATGDNFQKLGYNTILIESGHYPEDYQREKTKEYTFYSILQGLHHIAISDTFIDYEAYFTIPNNDKKFLDIIHKYKNGSIEGYQYIDEIVDNRLVSKLEKVPNNDVIGKTGHYEIVFESKNI
ncbi:M14 family zinc carboxypeptidase [Polaribacter sp. P097]|uniref:M14 family zinc carboxypeptidase n=1 Tax=Polaribacter sp. P097 TaxID=3117398 RepID=UPI002FE3A0C5